MPAWSLVALHSAKDQRTERIRSLTLGLRPHLNLNGVGMLGLLGGADSGGWEDIIVSFSAWSLSALKDMLLMTHLPAKL